MFFSLLLYSFAAKCVSCEIDIYNKVHKRTIQGNRRPLASMNIHTISFQCSPTAEKKKTFIFNDMKILMCTMNKNVRSQRRTEQKKTKKKKKKCGSCNEQLATDTQRWNRPISFYVRQKYRTNMKRKKKTQNIVGFKMFNIYAPRGIVSRLHSCPRLRIRNEQWLNARVALSINAKYFIAAMKSGWKASAISYIKWHDKRIKKRVHLLLFILFTFNLYVPKKKEKCILST